jgi:hypothetical protein
MKACEENVVDDDEQQARIPYSFGMLLLLMPLLYHARTRKSANKPSYL